MTQQPQQPQQQPDSTCASQTLHDIPYLLANNLFETAFNPWGQTDLKFDATQDADKLRRMNLDSYLAQRAGRASLLIVGDCAKWGGARFSGIPSVAEAMLIGNDENVHHSNVTFGPKSRSSRSDLSAIGMDDFVSITIWQSLLDCQVNPSDVVMWDAFPWFPHKGRFPNKTRPLNDQDMLDGQKLLIVVTSLFQTASVVAVGSFASQALSAIGVAHEHVKYPSSGGAPAFRSQLSRFLRGVGECKRNPEGRHLSLVS